MSQHKQVSSFTELSPFLREKKNMWTKEINEDPAMGQNWYYKKDLWVFQHLDGENSPLYVDSEYLEHRHCRIKSATLSVTALGKKYQVF